MCPRMSWRRCWVRKLNLACGVRSAAEILTISGISSTAELGDYVYGLPNVVSNENDVLKRFILRLNYDKPYSALVQIIR